MISKVIIIEMAPGRDWDLPGRADLGRIWLGWPIRLALRALLGLPGQSGLKACLAGLESLPGPWEPHSGLPGACLAQSFLPGNFTRMPAPARMHVGPHRGAVPAMNASRACEPGLRPPVSGREITKGRLSPGRCMPPPSRGREAQGAERADGTRPAAGFLLVRFRGRRGAGIGSPMSAVVRERPRRERAPRGDRERRIDAACATSGNDSGREPTQPRERRRQPGALRAGARRSNPTIGQCRAGQVQHRPGPGLTFMLRSHFRSRTTFLTTSIARSIRSVGIRPPPICFVKSGSARKTANELPPEVVTVNVSAAFS